MLAVAGCKNVDCGDGTTEQGGRCVPANETVGGSKCGPFTELQGDTCVSMFPPTVCDPGTTAAETDPETHVTTCIGTGGGGCTGAFQCPTPMTGKQTICGQIYDLENMTPFRAAGASGMTCVSGATTGPCALKIQPVDAIMFSGNPMICTGACDGSCTCPLANGGVVIDDCGRYRVPDISLPSGPLIGLGIDDAEPAGRGPAGVTNAVGVSTARNAGVATKNFDAYIASKTMTDAWATSGGPPVSGGIFVTLFRASKTGLADQAGVTVTRANAPIPDNDFYFMATEAVRDTVDPAATTTGANGTGLVINASAADGLSYSGQGGSLPAECRWELHAGASLPYIVFVQIFRPIDAVGMTCPL